MPTENESTTCHITQNVFEYQQKGKMKSMENLLLWEKVRSLPEILMLFLPKN